MAKKYLGTLGNWDFFVASAFGMHNDLESVREIQKERYRLIVNQRTANGNRPIDIFCTAIKLDHAEAREHSIFDDLDTTFHVFAVGGSRSGKAKGKLGCSCAYALESEESIGGVKLGLPHENRVSNGYPAGFDLEPFREKYTHRGKKTLPTQRCELYRHFKPVEFVGDKAASFGIYRSGYQELIYERRRIGKMPVTKWLFCSKPSYYQHLYRPFGAVLVPLLLNGTTIERASPPLRALRAPKDDHSKESGGYSFQGTPISYRYPVIISRDPVGTPSERWFDYFSEFVDWDRSAEIAKAGSSFLVNPHLNRVAWGVIAEHLFTVNGSRLFDRFLNRASRRITNSDPCSGWTINSNSQ